MSNLDFAAAAKYFVNECGHNEFECAQEPKNKREKFHPRRHFSVLQGLDEEGHDGRGRADGRDWAAWALGEGVVEEVDGEDVD